MYVDKGLIDAKIACKGFSGSDVVVVDPCFI